MKQQNVGSLKYAVRMQRFFGTFEIFGEYSDIMDAIKAIQIKKEARNAINPNEQASFSIITIK